MSDFYSPPPTARESAPRNDPKPSLPEGWKVHASKTYPGKIYFYNRLTDARVWNIEDIIPTGQGPGSPTHAPGASSGGVARPGGVPLPGGVTLPGGVALPGGGMALPREGRNALMSDYERELRDIEIIRKQKEKKQQHLEEMERIKKREILEKSQNSRRSDGSTHSSESGSSNASSLKDKTSRKDMKNGKEQESLVGSLALDAKLPKREDVKKRRENDRFLEERVKSIKSENVKRTSSSSKESNVENFSKNPNKSGKVKKEHEAVRHDEPFAKVPSFKIPKRGSKIQLKVEENIKRSDDVVSEFLKVIESKKETKHSKCLDMTESAGSDNIVKVENSIIQPKRTRNALSKVELNKSGDSFSSEKFSDDEDDDEKRSRRSWKHSERKRKLGNGDSTSTKLLKTNHSGNSSNIRSENNRNRPKFRRDEGRSREDRSPKSRDRSPKSRDKTSFSSDRSLPRDNHSPEPTHNNPLPSDSAQKSRDSRGDRATKSRDNAPNSRDSWLDNARDSCSDNVSMSRDSWKDNNNALKSRDSLAWSANRRKSSNARVPITFDSHLSLPDTSSHDHSLPSTGSGHTSTKQDYLPSTASLPLDEEDFDMEAGGVEAPILTSGLRHKGFEEIHTVDPYDALNYSCGSAAFSVMDDTLNISRVSTEHGSDSPGDDDPWCPDAEVDRPIDTSLTKEVEEEEAMEWEDGPSVSEAVGEAALARKKLEEDGRPMVVEDEDEESSASSEAAKTNSDLMVVVDTCVLMSSLAIVEQIRDNFSMEGLRPLVMIPWTLIRELDNIKDRKSTENKADVSARRAIKWIQAALRAKHPRMRQQTIGQEVKAGERFRAECGDDRILQYCMVLAEGGGKVVLFTNDRNLENKALIHGIPAGDHQNIVGQIKSVGNADGVVEREIGEDKVVDVDGIMAGVKEVLQKLLEGVMLVEMVEAFGDKLWKEIVLIKPRPSTPYWSIEDLFKLVAKHQIAVFSLAYPRQFRDILEEISDFVKKSCGYKLGDALDFVSKVQKFVGVVEARGKNAEEVRSAKDRLSEVEEEVNHKLVNVPNGDSLHDDDGENPVQNLFQNVWAMVYAVCYSLCECFQVPSGLEKSDPVFNLNSKDEASQHIGRLFGEVHRLGENLANLLDFVRENGKVDSDQAVLVTFLDQLTEFPGFLGVGDSWGPVPKATTRQLLLFVTSKSNSEILDMGLQQLVTFRDLLQKCCLKVEEDQNGGL